LTDAAYADYCVSRVVGALAQHGLATEIREPHLSPPRTRRRATLRALKVGGKVLIGFNELGGSRIVNMDECHILHPKLFGLLDPLRTLLGLILPAKRTAEAHLTLADQGVDLMLKGVEIVGLDAIEALTAFCEANGLARLSIDEGYGPEPRYEPRPVTITLGGAAPGSDGPMDRRKGGGGSIPVALPIGAFLQATDDGEAALVNAVREATAGKWSVADLFAGLGTFALGLGGQVTAAEASRVAVLALQSAANRACRP